jgi:putative DNA primase/helicase
MSSDPRGDFLAFWRAVGLEPVKAPELPEGEVARFRVVGDKPGSLNGWAVLHLLPAPWGIVGTWRTDEQHTWRDERAPRLTAAERAEQRRQAEAARLARAAELVTVQAAARAKAERLWQVARPTAQDHPYLARKGIRGVGLRRLGERLVVPGRDVDGTLHTLQFIGPDGGKRFLTGGRIKGVYCPIGTLADRLLIAEGVATAISLYIATGSATAAAFSAGNLRPVAEALRRKFPALPIVVCADDDTLTAGNPGRTAALDAARAVGGLVALPSLEITTQ